MSEYRVERSKSTENLPELTESLASAWTEATNEVKSRILESAARGQRLLLGYYIYWDDVTNGGHRQYPSPATSQ
jgi:hypothetical protein